MDLQKAKQIRASMEPVAKSKGRSPGNIFIPHPCAVAVRNVIWHRQMFGDPAL